MCMCVCVTKLMRIAFLVSGMTQIPLVRKKCLLIFFLGAYRHNNLVSFFLKNLLGTPMVLEAHRFSLKIYD